MVSRDEEVLSNGGTPDMCPSMVALQAELDREKDLRVNLEREIVSLKNMLGDKIEAAEEQQSEIESLKAEIQQLQSGALCPLRASSSDLEEGDGEEEHRLSAPLQANGQPSPVAVVTVSVQTDHSVFETERDASAADGACSHEGNGEAKFRREETELSAEAPSCVFQDALEREGGEDGGRKEGAPSEGWRSPVGLSAAASPRDGDGGRGGADGLPVGPSEPMAACVEGEKENKVKEADDEMSLSARYCEASAKIENGSILRESAEESLNFCLGGGMSSPRDYRGGDDSGTLGDLDLLTRSLRKAREAHVMVLHAVDQLTEVIHDASPIWDEQNRSWILRRGTKFLPTCILTMACASKELYGCLHILVSGVRRVGLLAFLARLGGGVRESMRSGMGLWRSHATGAAVEEGSMWYSKLQQVQGELERERSRGEEPGRQQAPTENSEDLPSSPAAGDRAAGAPVGEGPGGAQAAYRSPQQETEGETETDSIRFSSGEKDRTGVHQGIQMVIRSPQVESRPENSVSAIPKEDVGAEKGSSSSSSSSASCEEGGRQAGEERQNLPSKDKEGGEQGVSSSVPPAAAAAAAAAEATQPPAASNPTGAPEGGGGRNAAKDRPKVVLSKTLYKLAKQLINLVVVENTEQQSSGSTGPEHRFQSVWSLVEAMRSHLMTAAGLTPQDLAQGSQITALPYSPATTPSPASAAATPSSPPQTTPLPAAKSRLPLRAAGTPPGPSDSQAGAVSNQPSESPAPPPSTPNEPSKQEDSLSSSQQPPAAGPAKLPAAKVKLGLRAPPSKTPTPMPSTAASTTEDSPLPKAKVKLPMKSAPPTAAGSASSSSSSSASSSTEPASASAALETAAPSVSPSATPKPKPRPLPLKKAPPSPGQAPPTAAPGTAPTASAKPKLATGKPPSKAAGAPPVASTETGEPEQEPKGKLPLAQGKKLPMAPKERLPMKGGGVGGPPGPPPPGGKLPSAPGPPPPSSSSGGPPKAKGGKVPPRGKAAAAPEFPPDLIARASGDPPPKEVKPRSRVQWVALNHSRWKDSLWHSFLRDEKSKHWIVPGREPESLNPLLRKGVKFWFNQSAAVSLFFVAAKGGGGEGTKGKEAGDGNDGKGTGAELILGTKKVQAIEIMLRANKIPQTVDEIRNTLELADGEGKGGVTLDTLHQLFKLWPEGEELTKMQEQTPEQREKLGKADAYMCDLLKIKRHQQKLNTYTWLQTHAEELRHLTVEVRSYSACLDKLRGSHIFQALLFLVLRLGNLINHNSPRGGCVGFGLESLEVILDFPSADKTSTLQDFLMEIISTHIHAPPPSASGGGAHHGVGGGVPMPSLSMSGSGRHQPPPDPTVPTAAWKQLEKEIEGCKAAAKMDTGEQKGRMNQLKEKTNAVRDEMDIPEVSSFYSDEYRMRIRRALEAAYGQLNLLAELFLDVEKKGTELQTWLGCRTDANALKEALNKVASLYDRLHKARKVMCVAHMKKEEAEARARQRASRRSSSATAASKNTEGDSPPALPGLSSRRDLRGGKGHRQNDFLRKGTGTGGNPVAAPLGAGEFSSDLFPVRESDLSPSSENHTASGKGGAYPPSAVGRPTVVLDACGFGSSGSSSTRRGQEWDKPWNDIGNSEGRPTPLPSPSAPHPLESPTALLGSPLGPHGQQDTAEGRLYSRSSRERDGVGSGQTFGLSSFPSHQKERERRQRKEGFSPSEPLREPCALMHLGTKRETEQASAGPVGVSSPPPNPAPDMYFGRTTNELLHPFGQMNPPSPTEQPDAHSPCAHSHTSSAYGPPPPTQAADRDAGFRGTDMIGSPYGTQMDMTVEFPPFSHKRGGSTGSSRRSGGTPVENKGSGSRGQRDWERKVRGDVDRTSEASGGGGRSGRCAPPGAVSPTVSVSSSQKGIRQGGASGALDRGPRSLHGSSQFYPSRQPYGPSDRGPNDPHALEGSHENVGQQNGGGSGSSNQMRQRRGGSGSTSFAGGEFLGGGVNGNHRAD